MSAHLTKPTKTKLTLISPQRVSSSLSLILALVGCGLPAANDSRKRGGEGDQSSAPSVQLTVTGKLADLADGRGTNQRMQRLATKYELPPLPQDSLLANESPGPSPTIRVALMDLSGKILWEKTMEGDANEWLIPMEGEEGRYKFLAEVLTPPPVGYQQAKPWTKEVKLDLTMPKVLLSPVLRDVDAAGQRGLSVSLTVAGEDFVECRPATVEVVGGSESYTVPLQRDGRDGGSGETPVGMAFRGEVGLPSEALRVAPTVKASCSDGADNTVEVRELATAEPKNMTMTAKVVSGYGGPYKLADGATLSVSYLGSSNIDVEVEILDPTSGQALPPAVLSYIARQLSFYLTDKPVSGLEDLRGTKNLLWTQGYDRVLKMQLPPDLNLFRDVYLSMVNRDGVSATERLITTVRLPVFVDREGPRVTLEDQPLLAAPLSTSTLTLKGTVEVEGAQLAKEPQVEVSLDGKEWTGIPATVQASGKNYQWTFKYPYSNERDVRARITAVDLVGNRAETRPSDLLVARVAAAELGVTAAARQSCTVGGGATPGALLKAWLAASALCRKVDAAGTVGSTPYARLLMQNRGGAKPVFYGTTANPAGFGYKVRVNGVDLETAAGRFEPADPFALDDKTYYLFSFPLSQCWLTANKVEILFDVEQSGANSTTNSCYGAEPNPAVRVVILDRAAGLIPGISPFTCGADLALPARY